MLTAVKKIINPNKSSDIMEKNFKKAAEILDNILEAADVKDEINIVAKWEGSYCGIKDQKDIRCKEKCAKLVWNGESKNELVIEIFVHKDVSVKFLIAECLSDEKTKVIFEQIAASDNPPHKTAKKEHRDKLCEELQNSEYKKYITNELIYRLCKTQKFYCESLFKDMDKPSNGWNTLFKTESWQVQRYKNDNSCRILNFADECVAYGSVKQIVCPILEHCHREIQLENLKQRDWGIVFCGGGGKGAYQIGVWKYLIKIGLDKIITGVSGASVGALNSVLFVNGDYYKARDIWLKITNNHIMEDGGIVPLFQDQEPLVHMLRKYITTENWEKICKSDKIIYSALTGINTYIPAQSFLEYFIKGIAINKSEIKNEYYCWASRSKEEIEEIILASAAIPGVKKTHRFEGRSFVDGGFADNCPVFPLVKNGFRNIIVVHLSGDKKGADMEFKKAIESLDTRKTNFYHVYPSKPIGDKFKAFAALTEGRIALGYDDAKEQLASVLKDIDFQN